MNFSEHVLARTEGMLFLEDLPVLTFQVLISALGEEIAWRGFFVGKTLEPYAWANYIDIVSMPMLILQGDADFQIYPDKDCTLWQKALVGRDNVTFNLYEGLNHLMMPTQGKWDITEYQVTATVDPQVITDIADFILGE